MKVAIMQPYFFPYIGYFQLINTVDRFLLGDEVQYIYHGWINRNRILKPGPEGWIYITVPVIKHSHQVRISEIKVKEGNEWKSKIIHQFDHYKKKAPYYKEVNQLLQECFSTDEKGITKINARCLQLTCAYLGIDFKVEIQSEMEFDYSDVHDRCERPIQLCRQMGAKQYINPPGGKELYSKERFKAAGLDLFFIEPKLQEYKQLNREQFEPGLSILDVMMFNSPADIKQMLTDYQLV